MQRTGWLLAAVLACAVPPSTAGDAESPPPEKAVPGAAEPAPAASPSPAPAAEEKPTVSAPPGIELSGFVDTYYGYNFNKPAGDTQFRNFDSKHNQVSLSLIEIALEQKTAAESRLGFRADLDFGPVTDTVHAAEPGGADVFKAFEQAYLSYLAPAGKGLQLDVGKFVTPHGAEVIEAKDNWNYSRSLLFALAIPYYHVGLRATYPLSDKVSLAGFLVNGWNDGVDNNSHKTFGLQALVKPSASLSLAQNVMAGVEQAEGNDARFLSDTTVTWNVSPTLSLMANYDYGHDTVAGTKVVWRGVAAYARLQVKSWWALSPRFEWLDDGDGFMTGTGQKLKELTLTSEHKVAGALLTRLEYRRDFSDAATFVKDGDSRKSQTTFTLGLVYAFSRKL